MLLSELFEGITKENFSDMYGSDSIPHVTPTTRKPINHMVAPSRDHVVGPHQDVIGVIEGLINAVTTLRAYNEYVTPDQSKQISALVRELETLGFVPA